MEAILDNVALTVPRLLHGLDATTWAMVELAAQRGYATRIGFEDSAFLPDGRLAQSNEELVKVAVNVMNRYTL